MSSLDRIRICGFKSIRFVDFKLRSLNVLIGPNGAGKTNFIDLFRMLASVAAGRLRFSVAKQGGPDCLLFGGRRQTERIEVEFRLGADSYCFSLMPTGSRLVFEGGMARVRGGAAYRRTAIPWAVVVENPH